MPFKRKYNNKFSKIRTKGRRPANQVGSAPSRKRKGESIATLSKKLRKITKTIETKTGVTAITDNLGFQHNNMRIVNSTFLRTVAGVDDVENSQGQRIGDDINLISVNFKMMFELNEAFTDVTHCKLT